MLATLPAVAAAGFDVSVAAPADGALATALREQGVSHIGWRTHDDAGTRWPLDQLRADMAAIIRQHRPDLLHANSLSTARIAGPVAVDCETKSIGHLRDIIKLTRQSIADLNQHRKLIAVSNATRDFHLCQGLDAEKCVVVHNGIDLCEFRPRPPSGYLHRELGLPNGAKLIAVIGQLGLRKGTDVALAAAAQIANIAPEVHWLIIGDRTSSKNESHAFVAQLHQLASQPPLAGRVHFLGNRHDVAQLLSECTALVHAARQEPLGRVLLEAAACGTAVVATDVGGTREIFPLDSGAAILVPPDDADAIAKAVLLLFADEQRRTTLGASVRRRAESAFEIGAAAQRLITVYQETGTGVI